MGNKVVIDTNVLLESPEILDMDYEFILCSAVLEELDGLKKNPDIGYSAREVSRRIEANVNKIQFVIKDIYDNIPNGWSPDLRDNRIILTARDFNASILSNDLNVRLKAQSINIKAEPYRNQQNDLYTGYREVTMDDYEMDVHYQRPVNKCNLLINEYLLIKNTDGDVVDKQRWTDKGFVPVGARNFKSDYFDDFKAKDEYQICAIDSLLNSDFTLLFGVAGSAKTLLSLSYIMQRIQNKTIDKVIIIFNPTPLKGNQTLGFYPGSRDEKLLSSSIGGILSSKFGDMHGVQNLISLGKIVLLPTSDIRGIEVGARDCLFVTEAQNTDSYTMRTILQRAKEGCKIIIEGDLLEQVDIRCDSRKNGMLRAIEVFKGSKHFSCVKLKHTYRSPISEIAQNI